MRSHINPQKHTNLDDKTMQEMKTEILRLKKENQNLKEDYGISIAKEREIFEQRFNRLLKAKVSPLGDGRGEVNQLRLVSTEQTEKLEQ